MGDGVVATLREVLPADALRSTATDMAPYLTDWRGQSRGEAYCVALPRSTEQVAAVVRACMASDTAIIPQGGNTSLCAGAVPTTARKGVVVSLARMDRVRALDPIGGSLIAEAGCLLAAVQQAAEDADRLFPLSMGSEGSCQIGGNVSTNAGGTAVLRYGNTRELVLGLEVVTPNGDVWDGLRTLRKDNTGYDLKQLFIGAEGTLGIVTAAALRIFPRPRDTAHAWIGVDSPDQALSLLERLQDRFDARLTAAELLSDAQVALVLERLPDARSPLGNACPWHFLVQLCDVRPDADLAGQLVDALGHPAAMSHLLDAAVAQSAAQAEAFWRIRHALSEVNKAHGVSITLDVAVPLSRVPAFLNDANASTARHFPTAEVLIVAHLGDGNVHYIVQYAHERWRDVKAPDSLRTEVLARLHDIALMHGGTFSAEHGIGQKLKSELARHKSPTELAMFRSLKSCLDPRGLMNPGKLLPD